MKKCKFLIILLTAIFLLTGCSKNYLTEISYDDYKQLIEDKETFVLEVMQENCVNCEEFRPKLKSVAEEYQIDVKFIDITELTEEQKDEFGVSGTPTLIFYIEGEEETTSARLVGNKSRDKIIAKFKASDFIKE